jgi:CheY-like chemotaxis protein/signal transduction histidine kinase
MPQTNKIMQFLSSDIEGKYDVEILNRILLIKIFSLIGAVISIVYGIIDLFHTEFAPPIIAFVVSVIIIGNYVYLNKTKKHFISANLIVIVMGLFFLSRLIFNDPNGSGHLWFFLFPGLAIFIFNLKRGLIYCIVFFLLVVLYFILSKILLQDKAPELNFILGYLGALLSIGFVSYCYQYLRSNAQQSLEKLMLNSQKAYKEKTEFVSKLSHQIRTPLNNIMGIIDFIQETKLDSKQKDFIGTIQASANNLVTAVGTIDEVSKAKIDTLSTSHVSFNLKSTINSTINLFLNQNLDNILFHFSFSNDIPDNVIGNPIRMKQIFLNLIENFIKYKSSDSLIVTINVTINKESKDTLNCLFELKSDKPLNLPKSDTTKDISSIFISSLDLSITKKIIESSNGKFKIGIHSNRTIFSFTMPFKKSVKREIEEEVSIQKRIEVPIKIVTSSVVELKNANLLLVEDNLINQKIVLLSLKKMVNNIDIAHNGKEALDKFGKIRYDLILMDVQMPIMDGIKTTIKVREIEAGTNSHTPIIAMTANALMGDKEDCLAAGMDDYISKPFKLDVLVNKIKHHLSIHA